MRVDVSVIFALYAAENKMKLISVPGWVLNDSPRHPVWPPVASLGNLQGSLLYDKAQVLKLSSRTVIY